ncbi:hypothetical protein [Erythrobacter sp. THAF29]|uniref:hypothetical protein n=1 Tax=Erythrobacter sp. THAF29 TaxID=2587851 RepID=UPI001268AC88|nr:hypothetical protein [Erythrobacter sp. THAF29]QFT78794.1 hypothetical protein FIU90_14685 [Erythrobacter sp. THAF29]
MNDGIVGTQLGETESRRGWRIFFWAAAIFNFLVGLSGMLAPGTMVDTRIIGLLVFAFGIVYMLVARDPLRFGPVLWAGVVGKVGVVALLALDAFSPEGSVLARVVIGIDAVFAIGFLVFLITSNEDDHGLPTGRE